MDFSAKQTLIFLIKFLSLRLEELKEAKAADKERFAYGEKTAYAECLEMILFWKEASVCGLNFDVEERFPL